MPNRDFSPQIQRAQAAIERNGREITLMTSGDNPVLRDPAHPEDGYKDAPAEGLTVWALFGTSPSSWGFTRRVDDLVKNSDKTCILSAGAHVDLKKYTQVNDNLRFYKIEVMEHFQPNDQTIITLLGLKG